MDRSVDGEMVGDFGGFAPEDDEMWREIRRFLDRIARDRPPS